MDTKEMILLTSELMIDKGMTVALPQGDEHSEVDREMSNIATSNGDRVNMDNASMGESQHRTKQRELTDLRPSREKGPRSDLAKELGPGRLKELQTAYKTLDDTMRQVELDSKEHKVTETWAKAMYDIIAKLCHTLQSRLNAVRYLKLAEPYEASCVALLSDCDDLMKRLPQTPLSSSSAYLTSPQASSDSKTLVESKPSVDSEQSDVASQRHLNDDGKAQEYDHSSLRGKDTTVSETRHKSYVIDHSVPRSRSASSTSYSNTASSKHSSASSQKRIIQSQAAAIDIKRKAMAKMVEMQRQQDALREQLELDEKRRKQEERQRKIKEEMEEAQRKLSNELRQAELEIEETRKRQELERQMNQMKAEEEEARLQMELDAANAAMRALDDDIQSQDLDSVLSSLQGMNPVIDLYTKRHDEFATASADNERPALRSTKEIAHSNITHANPATVTTINPVDNSSSHRENVGRPVVAQNTWNEGQAQEANNTTKFQIRECQGHTISSRDSHSMTHNPRTKQEPYAIRGKQLNAEAATFLPQSAQPIPARAYENVQFQAPAYYGPCNSNTFPNASSSNSLAKSIADALSITRLPVPKPTIFKGDPLQYPAWFAAFSHLVENEAVSPKDKMLILRDFIDGPARAAVGDLYYELGEDSYNSALEILKRRFGEDYAIAEAMKDKLTDWPDVKTKDVASLRDFADYVRQCHTMSKRVTGLGILEDPAQIRILARKLPDALGISWGRQVADHKLQHGAYPPLADFVKFLERQSDALKEADLMSKGKKPMSGESRNLQKAKGGQTFATSDVSIEQNEVANNSTEGPPERKAYGQRGKCLFCDREHCTPDCVKLAKKPFEERKEFARKKRLCFRCLKGFHASRGCFAKVSCGICKSKHVTVMHDPNYTPARQSDQEQGGDQELTAAKTIPGTKEIKVGTQGPSSGNYMVEGHVHTRLCSLYMPVYVSAKADPDNEIMVYAMLDTMSDTSFIIESVMEKLSLETRDSTLTLRTLTTDRAVVKCKACSDLCVRAVDSHDIVEIPLAYSQKELCVDKRQIPTRQTVLSIPHLCHLSPHFHDLYDAPIGLLLGVNVSEALRPLEVEGAELGQPFAQRTRLGWGVVGEMKRTRTKSEDDQFEGRKAMRIDAPIRSGAKCFRTKDCTNERLIAAMERDFACPDADEYPISQEDLKFIQILSKGITQKEEGHYQMPLPFKDGEPRLPDNRGMALRRLSGLKQKFLTNPEHFRLYKDFVHQMLERHDAERVDDEGHMPGSVWYIPHHGVYNPNKPGKVRVVFDCAARFQGASLNDFLLCGPDLMNSLVGVLCRFRLDPVAFSCDIEQMFHQFHVAPQHRNYLRFLWWPNDDLNAPPVDYRMRVHLFGAASSPGCANFALKRLAIDNEQISPDASRFIQNDFYVDDGLKSSERETDAVKLLQGARAICQKGNLRLHKIASNSSQVLSAFPKSDTVKPEGACELGEMTENSVERALGIRWNLSADTLHLLYMSKETPTTKRGVLSTVASIFDPLGLVSPIILKGRQILQEACREGIDWDEELPPALLGQWKAWLLDLEALSSMQIPRCYFTKAGHPWMKIEFHHFSDASNKGYGECSYLRVIDYHGNPHSSLVMAKAKVTPLKTVTIPRLELQAAVLAVKIARFLDKEFNHLQALHHFWTDSRVVLAYIYNEARRFHVFVANRLQQIREFSQPQQWSYIATDQNPADHTSRGLKVEEIMSSNWEKGPEFLQEKTIVYNVPEVFIEDNDKEVKAFTVQAASGDPDDIEKLIKRFSTLDMLLRVVARMITWRLRVEKTNIQSQTMATPLSDREAAFHRIVRSLQIAHYPPKSRSAHPELRQIDPFTDEEGLLRVGGRLSHLGEERRVKNPLIIPCASHLAVLLARHHHKKVAHQGRTTTMGALQSNGLWICGARKVVSAVIHTCTHCARLRGRPMEQKMADLPPERTDMAPPFTNTGLDCFGPFLVKQGRSEVKRYGLIFTCLASRAVHLEVLEDMTTDAFICGLRRFIAIRGNVKSIHCDRGTNFVGASGELRKARQEMSQDKIVEQMVERNCNFSFNPPSASHFGGVWERLIHTVRQVLSGLLQEHGGRLTSDTLSTLFYEVAGIINNRPLCVNQLGDPNACEPLTPNHLLTLKPDPIFPPPGRFHKEDVYSRKRWRRVQYLVEQFWSRWKLEYLPTLQPRRKWYLQKDAVKPNMLVLVTDEGAPRGTWKMARVEKTYPSRDGLVRSVQLKMAAVQKTDKGKLVVQTTFVDRPVHKLVPLNLSED